MTSRISRVILYKHGMASFERMATVEGDATVSLTFRQDEMDDALKSLAVVDHGGGQLATVAYDPHPDLAAHLDDVRIELPQRGGLLALLGQLIGAEIRAHLGAEQLTGRVLGIERVAEAHGEAVLEAEHLSLVTDGALRRLRIGDIDHIEPVDASLRRDLSRLLERLDAGRLASRRRMSLDLRGEGPREVWMSYTVPATVWKTSYRVVFEGEGARPNLLGFALVDNDSPDDWRDVTLSLVSGLPISFTHDLYSPRRRARPHVRVEVEAPIAPPVLEGVEFQMEEADEDGYGADFSIASPPPPPRPMAPPAPSAAPAPKRRAAAAPGAFGGVGGGGQALASTARVTTRTQELGDQFRYDVTTPVTIRSGHSALVPILADQLDGELVAIYNEKVRAGNPLTAFRLTNSSTLTLEGGPATVYRDGEYVGEAMLDTMRPGEERLVPFSVELGCRITTAFDTRSETQQSFRASGGYLVHTTWERTVTTYTIKNVTSRPLKVLIDHPGDRHAAYVETPRPEASTDSYDRFAVEAPPGKQRSFAVTQRRQRAANYWFSPKEIERHLTMVRTSGDHPDLVRALEPLGELSRALASTEFQINNLRGRIQDITKQQARIRENLKTLGLETQSERELRERYVASLDADETRLAELQQHETKLSEHLGALTSRFQQEAAALEL